MSPFVTKYKKMYLQAGYSKERFAWDMLWVSDFKTAALYQYLCDSHIQTALYRIVGEY